MTVSLPNKKVRRSRTSNKMSEEVDVVRRVRAMPTEVGVLLIVSGIGGILLPGPVGTPFLILGCLMLWPKAFQNTGKCFEKHFPTMHRHGVTQINRYLDDLEKRYPLSK
jgi:hypothetical protein